jgi:hypothetical protein
VIHLDTNSVLQPVRDPDRMLDVSWLCIINPHLVIQKQWLHHKPAKTLASTGLKKPGNSLSQTYNKTKELISLHMFDAAHKKLTLMMSFSSYKLRIFNSSTAVRRLCTQPVCVQSIQDPEDAIHSTMFQLQVIDPYVSAHISIATKSITLTLFKCKAAAQKHQNTHNFWHTWIPPGKLTADNINCASCLQFTSTFHRFGATYEIHVEAQTQKNKKEGWQLRRSCLISYP